MVSQTFPKEERIRAKCEIDHVFRDGCRYSCNGMRLHVLPNGLQINRAVFVTVRSYPGAVERNRARRVIRECWRLAKASFNSGFDVAFVLYPGDDGYSHRRSQLLRLLRQAGLISMNP